MAKLQWLTKEEISLRLESGRGTGRKSEYKPWIHIQDISSDGTSYRVLSHRTGRVVHLLSKLEYLAFSLFDWDETIQDIREQYPLNIETSLEVAEKSGIKHPQKGNKYHVFTTDLVVDYDAFESEQTAIQVKYIKDLMDKDVIAKLEIERRCCIAMGMKWKLITDLDIPHIQQVNVDWILGGKDLHINENIEVQVSELWTEIQSSPNLKLVKACADFDKRHGQPVGEALRLARNAFSYRLLAFDITKPYQNLYCNDIQNVSLRASTGELYAVG
tara:strand:+ start:10151 stop:10969 length:819 start_codon:yes stop_codon:yes gene_type:complete